MATKRLLIDLEEGNTKCENCPFSGRCSIDIINMFGCTEYNLATMKINTEEVTKEKMLKEVIDWIEEKYDTDYVGGDVVRMLKNRLKEEEK